MQKNIMKTMENKYKEHIAADIEGNKKSAKEALDYMTHSLEKHHNEEVHYLYMSKLFSEEAVMFLQKVAKTTYGILGKIIREYKKNANYRKAFAFPKELEEWMLIPTEFSCHLPISRIDLFFNEDDFSFRFCEFNADGTSGMSRDKDVFQALSKTLAFQEMEKEYEITSFELIKSWVKAFETIYRDTKNPKEHPFIVITDFLERANLNDFETFRDAFLAAGYDVEIAEIRSLSYKNGKLYTKEGKAIDAIYRRAVTGDLYEKREEVRDFITGIKENAVTLIGPLSTQIIHNKILFSILRSPETKSILNKEEWRFVEEHIPYTVPLAEYPLKDVIENKNHWIIKPRDLYASLGVYAGIDMDEVAWEKVVTENYNSEYLLQEFCSLYPSENYDFNYNKGLETYNNMTGIFLYNGEMVGLYSRAGQKGVISSLHHGKMMATAMAKKR